MTTYKAKKIVLKDADGSYLIPYTTPYKGGDAISVNDDKISINREELYCYNKAEIDQMLSKNVSLPVGTELAVYCTEKYVPTGCVPEDGAEYTKEQFPDLWNDYLGRSSGPRVTWGDEHAITSNKGVNHLAYGNGKYMAAVEASSKACIVTSEDGLTWSELKYIPGLMCIDALSFVHGKFIAVGTTDLYGWNSKNQVINNYSVVSESVDGKTWSTPVVINKSYCEFGKVAYGYGKYVVIGGGLASTWVTDNAASTYDAGNISTSTNGTTWGNLKAVINKTTAEWVDIIYANNIFVMVGKQLAKPKNDTWSATNGLIATSLNGVDWTQRKLNGNDFNIDFDKVIFDGEKFIAFGTALPTIGTWLGKKGTYITTSVDGITWTPIKTVSSTAKFQDACYVDNKYHVVCELETIENTPSSRNLIILESYDLVEWVQSTILINNYKYSSAPVRIQTNNDDAIITLGKGRLYHMVKSAPQETKLLPTCSYEEYDEYMKLYGQCAKFGINIETETFRVPFKKNGVVTQQALTDDELSKVYEAGVPNITGTIGNVDGGGIGSSDAFYREGESGKLQNKSGVADPNVHMDASRCSKVYGNSDTVQMEAIALRHFVVIANGQVNQSMMDWAAWASSLQAKLNADHSNDTVPYIRSIVMEGTEGYIIYSNGFCEQWGKVNLDGATNEATVSLHFNYINKDYFVDVQVCNTSRSTNAATGIILEDANNTYKTTASFKYGAYGKFTGFYWKTRGFINL